MKEHIEQKFKVKIAELRWDKDDKNKINVIIRFAPFTPISKMASVIKYVKANYIIDSLQYFV